MGYEKVSSLLERVYEAQSMVHDRDNLGSEEFISSVLSEVVVYLEENAFISVKDRLPAMPHADWEYDSVCVLGAVENEYGRRWTKPVRFERTKLRGKQVELWTEPDGRLMWNCEVTHWREYPAPPEKD